MSRRSFLQFVSITLLSVGISTTAGEASKVCELKVKTDGGKFTVSTLNRSFTIGSIQLGPSRKAISNSTLTVEAKMEVNDSELSDLVKHLISTGYTSVRISK